MGKPFKKELESISDIYRWAFSQPKTEFFEIIVQSKTPTLIIGSGGSLSACHYLETLLTTKGIVAKSMTPLELIYSKNIIRNSNLVFLSASGKNNDILHGFNRAIEFEPKSIFCFCMKKNSPLARLSKLYSNTWMYEYDLPTGKDGFLATNSLIAFFSILLNNFKSQNEILELSEDESFKKDLLIFSETISAETTYQIIYGGWGKPVAVDLESKFTEAGLASVLLSDYRNFGHGRHNWFDKKPNSAIIALVTPEEELIAKKTISLLPTSIPKLIVWTKFTSALASIDLLIKSFNLVNKIGDLNYIDPGRPGVPEYGRKLYNLKYSSFYNNKSKNYIKQEIANAILRKTKANSISDLNSYELDYWLNAYNVFIKKLTDAKFGSLIFDFDGTLCSSENRLSGLNHELSSILIRFLDKGFIIAVTTGRGQSVRIALQKAIPKKYWKNFYIGYYNGSVIGSLEDDTLPNKMLDPDESIVVLTKVLKEYNSPYKINLNPRPNQLSIEIENKKDWQRTRDIIIDLVMLANIPNIQLIESSHSIDLISKKNTSKLNIIPLCKHKAKSLGLSEDCLCIGDKGDWPGNDFELLSSEFSLSVDEVSSISNNCWNIAKVGYRNVMATLYYLNNLEIIDNSSIIYKLP